MRLVRLKIRELAAKRIWTIKEVAERVQKLARAFYVSIEDFIYTN